MIRVSVVGLGMAFEPHARALADLAGRVEVRWAASRSPERLSAAQRHGFPATCDVEAALTDPEVDAVVLLTPPNTHRALGAIALSAGKHLLVEKPLDANLESARDLVRAAARADVRLGVVLQHRFRPAAMRLSSLVASGALGAIQFAAATVPWWRPQAYYDEPGRGELSRDGGGVLMTQAFHTLDLFRSMFDPMGVTAARATTTALHRMETEDHVCALLALPGGGPATFMATTAYRPGRAERIEIVGEDGTASLEGEALAVQWLDGRCDSVGDTGPTGSGGAPMDFGHTAHRALIEDFCSAVSDGRDPIASGREALATQELIAEIMRSAGQIRRLAASPAPN